MKMTKREALLSQNMTTQLRQGIGKLDPAISNDWIFISYEGLNVIDGLLSGDKNISAGTQMQYGTSRISNIIVPLKKIVGYDNFDDKRMESPVSGKPFKAYRIKEDIQVIALLEELSRLVEIVLANRG